MAQTPYTETEALLAVMDEDDEELGRLLGEMTDMELSNLSARAYRLAASASSGAPSSGSFVGNSNALREAVAGRLQRPSPGVLDAAAAALREEMGDLLPPGTYDWERFASVALRAAGQA